MKRSLAIGFILVCCVTGAFSQNKSFEGYDGFPWGTTIEKIKSKYPSVVESTDQNDKLTNERIFTFSNTTNFRIFRFYKEKLYWGRTAYINTDISTGKALINKIKDLYGKFDTNDSTKNAEKASLWYSWNISETFSVTVEFTDWYNEYDKIASNSFFITYVNVRVSTEIQDIMEKQIEEKIEL